MQKTNLFTPESPLNILFYWKVNKELRNYLENPFKDINNINLIFLEEIEGEALSQALKISQIIIGWRPKKEHLDKAINLKIYMNPGAGITHLIEMFRELNEKRKIILINGHGNAYFTAQHAVALLLSVLNKVILHHDLMFKGVWRTGDEEGKSIPLRNKTIGLLGYGHVNQLVHKFLSGFDLQFNILRNNWEKGESSELLSKVNKYSTNQIDSFLRSINILIVALPLTSETKNLIDLKKLQLLQPNSILINVSRGLIINEKDLYTALKKGIILGAGIDVWYDYNPEEKKGKKYPFKESFHLLDNIILSPHRAASPMDDLNRWDEVIKNLFVILTNKGSLTNIVDLENEY
ncbi:MAG: Glyoxylate reductase [Candidatus Heimdallarchaeota archaeon LC_3]|nr:MAG: Glyoxylate reductase [Candidatus Heimdallarchaeota archaeon LC_3]